MSICIALLFTLSILSQQRIRLEINLLPANNPSNSSIFIAGNFNGWNPQHKDYQFQKNDGGYFIELSLNPGSYEYKITRGGWDKVECTFDGNDIDNRSFKIESGCKGCGPDSNGCDCRLERYACFVKPKENHCRKECSDN